MEPLSKEEIEKRHEEINQLSDSVNKAVTEEWRDYMKR